MRDRIYSHLVSLLTIAFVCSAHPAHLRVSGVQLLGAPANVLGAEYSANINLDPASKGLSQQPSIAKWSGFWDEQLSICWQ